MIVILQAQRPRLSRKRLTGAPAVAIEIVSYTSKRTDRLQKRLRRVERWRPADTEPELVTGRLIRRPAPDVPPFELDLLALFAASNA